jgi:hypothetical protein
MPPFIVDAAGMYRYYIVDQLSVDGICVPVLRKSGLSLKKKLDPFLNPQSLNINYIFINSTIAQGGVTIFIPLS